MRLRLNGRLLASSAYFMNCPEINQRLTRLCAELELIVLCESKFPEYGRDRDTEVARRLRRAEICTQINDLRSQCGKMKPRTTADTTRCEAGAYFGSEACGIRFM